MPGFNKREAIYAQAREDLMNRMADNFVAELPEHERGEQVAQIVHSLQHKYQELDEPMMRRLMSEGMQADAEVLIRRIIER